MPKSLLRIAAHLVVLLASVSALAEVGVPDNYSYVCYLNGMLIGTNEISIEETDEGIVATSLVNVTFSSGKLDLVCKTVVDPVTFQVQRFEYEGEKSGQQVEGLSVVDDYQIIGHFTIDGTKFPSRVDRQQDFSIYFEDYVVEHQFFLALAHLRAENSSKMAVYESFSPTNFTVNYFHVTTTSDVLVETETEDLVLKRVEASLAGSPPFVIFLDEQRQVTVYAYFSSVQVEFFLEDFFGPTPVSRFHTDDFIIR